MRLQKSYENLDEAMRLKFSFADLLARHHPSDTDQDSHEGEEAKGMDSRRRAYDACPCFGRCVLRKEVDR